MVDGAALTDAAMYQMLEQCETAFHPQKSADCHANIVCCLHEPDSSSVDLQVSFVNSICTSKGGTHVDLLANQICK